mmetsp:Transcript_34589/g.42304  ORF Transcript_34589/g.42304 Transcript_34589/m.42304 type:complete len:126 (-) Transcript_34589:662-1039(-)
MRKAAFNKFNKRKTAASSNMAALWGIIMGQCSVSLQKYLKVEEDYENHLYDSVWLLETIKKVILGVTHQSNVRSRPQKTIFVILKQQLTLYIDHMVPKCLMIKAYIHWNTPMIQACQSLMSNRIF